jgi:hypothetical protein
MEGIRILALDAGDQGREDRQQDQEHDKAQADQGHLAAANASPGQLQQRPTLDRGRRLGHAHFSLGDRLIEFAGRHRHRDATSFSPNQRDGAGWSQSLWLATHVIRWPIR